MTRVLTLCAVLAALLLGACSAPATSTPAEPALALMPCRLSAPGLTARTIAAECGTLGVPENRATPDSRTLDLRVVRLPALSRAGADDPLFLLAGGPGQAASEAFLPLLPSLVQVQQRRDIVLVDQRGTGASNPLTCPIEPQGELADAAPEDPAAQAWWRDCLATLEADPTQYTTAIAATDLDAVRDALGYEQVSLLGVSYGTRAALTYLRLYPERVRALVLDGVVPPDMAIGAAMGRDGQRALELIFAACAAEPACAAAFPDPAGDFTALLDRLEAETPTVRLDDPNTGAPTEVRLTRELAALTVHGMSYTPELSALLPLLIHTAQREGDLRPLAAQSLISSRQLTDQIALGMRAAVICAEDAPAFPAAPTGEGYLRDLIQRSFAAACAVWPAGTTSAEQRSPVRAETPTLLLSGERDPVTPPAYGDVVASGLPNSLHLVAPAQGHSIFFRGCVPSLIAEFLEAGSVTGLDASCVQRLGTPPFFTSFTGP